MSAVSKKSPRLTQQQVERSRCPEGESLLVLKDHKLPQMGLKVYPSGKKSYFVRVRSQGMNTDHKLGDGRVLSLQQARALAQQVLSEYALGKRTLKPSARQSPLLDDFFYGQYWPYIQKHHKSRYTTWCLYRAHLQPALGSTRMHQITEADLLGVQASLSQCLAPASTNRVLVVMKTIYTRALAWKVPGVVGNPTLGVSPLKLNNKKERYLTDEEMQRLLQGIQNAKAGEYLLPVIQMLALTGARKREVLDLRWQDLDLAKRRWRLEKNKSGKTQYKPLSEAVIQLLLAQQQRLKDWGWGEPEAGQDWVFPYPKTGQPLSDIYDVWDRVRKKVGLAEVRIHDLRHNFASQLVNAGRSLYEVQKLLGHADVSTTQRYAHLSQERLLEAASSVRLPDASQSESLLSSLRPQPSQKTLNQVQHQRHQQDALALLREAGWQEEELAGLFATQGNEGQSETKK